MIVSSILELREELFEFGNEARMTSNPLPLSELPSPPKLTWGNRVQLTTKCPVNAVNHWGHSPTRSFSDPTKQHISGLLLVKTLKHLTSFFFQPRNLSSAYHFRTSSPPNGGSVPNHDAKYSSPYSGTWCNVTSAGCQCVMNRVWGHSHANVPLRCYWALHVWQRSRCSAADHGQKSGEYLRG